MIYSLRSVFRIKVVSLGLVSLMLSCRTPEPSHTIDYLGQTPPVDTASVFAPGIITTPEYEHSSPAFSPNGTVVLWTVVSRSYRGAMREMVYENGKWSASRRPSFADSTADDYYPSFSPDGKTLYFSSRRKLPAGYPPVGDMRIWKVDRINNTWGSPVPIDTLISTGREYAQSVSANGTIYFSASMPGGTSFNICRSGGPEGYSELPFNINSVDYEDGPFIAPDESYIIFETQRPEGVESSIDLYISFRNVNGDWSLPLNMGPRINSAGSERFAKLSPDGKYLFFGTTRDQAEGRFGFDIYWVDAKIIEELRGTEAAKKSIDTRSGIEVLNALKNGNAEQSATLLELWLQKNPGTLDATIVYSTTLRKQERFSEAEKVMTDISPNRPANAGVQMEIALAWYGMNKDAEAQEILTSVLVPGPRLEDRYKHLSSSLLDMKKLEISDEYFEKAMSISPHPYMYFRRAKALALMGEKDRAFAALNKSVELGFANKANYENDEDLKSLQVEKEWKVLVKKLE